MRKTSWRGAYSFATKAPLSGAILTEHVHAAFEHDPQAKAKERKRRRFAKQDLNQRVRRAENAATRKLAQEQD